MHELRLGSVVVPVLYIDDDIIAVNKPAGLPVFTAPGKVAGTLTEVALASGVTLYDGEGVELPGVVHRQGHEWRDGSGPFSSRVELLQATTGQP